MGTFLSDHPLSQVREALRVRADCTLAELEKKPDGATVTVGGIVSEAKKIRTKTGNTMMFATLDDLEGRVEMIIFAKTLEANGDLIDTDAVLLVRGRVDRKDRGEIKLVVHDAEPFEPTSDEVETAKEKVRELDKPLTFPLHLDAADYDPSIIEELKSVFASFPGDAEVVLEMKTREGVRTLRFGECLPGRCLGRPAGGDRGPARPAADRGLSGAEPAASLGLRTRIEAWEQALQQRSFPPPGSAGAAARSATS